MKKENFLVSACLLGIECRYDGKDKKNDEILKLMNNYHLIPVCPEQLGGLETPRSPTEKVKEKLLTIEGNDVTLNYQRGAEEALKICKIYDCQTAYLKAFSPMCGCGQIYDGSFSGKKIEGNGVFADLLIKKGIKIISK